MKTFTNAQKQELSAMIAEAVAQAMAAQVSARTKAPKEPKVAFTKKDGTVKMVSKAQADAWTQYRDNAQPFDADAWNAKRSAYKPSKALKDAIKANRAAITHKVAKEAYGFVGTKKDLAALKESICK